MLNILTQDAGGEDAQVDDAARFRGRYGLTWHVLADERGDWMAAWGANGGTSQHSYAVVDARGVLTWRKADGGATTVTEVESAVADAAD